MGLPKTTGVEAFDKQIEECLGILGLKGAEYQASAGIDTSFFKEAAEELGISPYQVLGVLARKHWQSVVKFMASGGTKKGSEPITGRISDLVNYLLFLRMLFEEEGHAEPEKQPDELTLNDLRGNPWPAVDIEGILVRKDLIEEAIQVEPRDIMRVEKIGMLEMPEHDKPSMYDPDVQLLQALRQHPDPEQITVMRDPLESVEPPAGPSKREYSARLSATSAD
jgi:hypothetical protein